MITKIKVKESAYVWKFELDENATNLKNGKGTERALIHTFLF